MFETFSSAFNQVTEKKFDVIEDIVNQTDYGKYKKIAEENPEIVSFLRSFKIGDMSNLDLELNKDIPLRDEIVNDSISKKIGLTDILNLFGVGYTEEGQRILSHEEILEEAKIKIKEFQSYDKINNQRFFRDYLGEYTNFINGEKKANLGRILNDQNNYISTYNTLLEAYKDENKNYNIIDDDNKSEVFYKWLQKKFYSMDEDDKRNELENVLKNFYKNDDGLKI